MKGEGEKIKVLFIIVQMKMGGSEHLVLDLIRNLDRTVFSPYLAWFYEQEPLKEFADLELPLFFVPKLHRFDFGTMRTLARIIRKHGIDIVNAHHFLSLVYAFYGAKMINRAKLVYTEHSEWELQAIRGKWLAVGRSIARCIDAAIGISDKVKRCLEETLKLPAEKVFSVKNGVDCTLFFRAGDQDKVRAKQSLGLDRDDLVVAMVANLKKNKNHLFLLEAFRRLSAENGTVKLLLVGQGFSGDPENSEQDIHGFVRQFGLDAQVLLMGGRSDVPELLRAADIFCLTSSREGLPISLIEAMASGLPVVGTDVEGIQDVIVPHENGFLVRLFDVEELHLALRRLAEDESMRREMGRKSEELARRCYAIEHCIDQHQHLFRRL
ncbi:glycosyltransferase [Desulfogranum mediterraneum]|uniref:glycosyltransferase n=1 Tax=Desulfogranum mediterraneum TaxID=160661 RepID=UPI0004185FCC|nr:glycosyltransferase [Desulfogranum mediterraneum]